MCGWAFLLIEFMAPTFFEGNITKLIKITQFSLFLENINSANYLEMLKKYFLPQLSRVRKRQVVSNKMELLHITDGKFENFWITSFQEDGCEDAGL